MQDALFVMNEDDFSIEAVEWIDGGDDQAADARTRYKEDFPGRSARRMTHLGMMVGLCLKKLDVEREVPIIYASAFAESSSLEKFIDSFPEASPALFQSSIHPSAVEQALIPGKQAIDRFYPITSNTNLGGKALENCFLMGENSVVLVGGEERGTWLCEYDFASHESFAIGLRLRRGKNGLGRVSIDHSEVSGDEEGVSFSALVTAIKGHQAIRIPSFALDAWIQIDWR